MKRNIITTILFTIVTTTSLFGQAIKINNKEYKEAWDVFLLNENNTLFSVTLNFGLNLIAPIKNNSNLIEVSVKMNNPRTDGLSSTEERETLYSIEDKLIELLNSTTKYIYIGRTTKNNFIKFYYYSKEQIDTKKMETNLHSQFSSYEIKVTNKEDANWDLYKSLYPTPLQNEKIQNAKVVQQLANQGDVLIKSRDVFHWSYFKTDAQRTKFIEAITKLNYTILEKPENKEAKDFPYAVQIKRNDKVDLESVNEYAIRLYEIAIENGGRYDGWETSVEKD